MKGRSGLLAVVATTIGVAACGGSSSSLALNAYTVHGREEPGYAGAAPADYRTTLALETKGSQELTVAAERRLDQEGFRGAAVEHTGGGNGLSMVYELGSVAGAERELAAEVHGDLGQQGEQSVRFAVSSIPGAVGVAYPSGSSGSPSGGNVLFQEGRCFLLVGDLDAANDYRAPAIAGALAIWKRTHGRAGACAG